MLHHIGRGLRVLKLTKLLVHQNCAIFRRKIYSFSGIEWTHERDRQFEEKMRPYKEQEQKRRDTKVEDMQLSEEELMKLNAIKMEYQIIMGDRVEYIQDHEWLTLLDKPKNKRIAMAKLFIKKATSRLKKQEASIKNETENQKPQKIFPRSVISKFTSGFYSDAIKPVHQIRSCIAKQYGVPLVIDFGYDSLMVDRETTSLLTQINYVISRNRDDPDPFNLIYANFKISDQFTRKWAFNQSISQCLVDKTEHCYTTLFPREQLVYLSPHAKKTLSRFDPTKVYIIGALVDKRTHEPDSLKLAEASGVQTAALPFKQSRKLDGRNVQNIDTMVNILLRLKYHNNFEKAIEETLPRRFLKRS